jgi:LacI family transcriptional regulator
MHSGATAPPPADQAGWERRAADGPRLRVGRPTMNDVAARAGVGLKTVSRVVNGEPGVLPSTAALVRRAIDELGFRRNDSARQLRTGRTAGIGLVLEDVADPFYSLLTGAVEEVAHAHGSLLFSASSQDDPRLEAELALALCARRVDGLIIVPAAQDHGYLAPEVDAGLAMVFADRPPVNLAADTVLVDNAAGARQGVAHLLGHGHRRIGYLGDSARIYTSAQRLLGYRAAMAEAAAPVDESWITLGAPEPQLIRSTLSRLLDPGAYSPVTALFTANNRVTVAVLRELAQRSRAGPDEPGPALVGFDDFELADLLSPGVTVVAQDPVGLGRTSAELLFVRLGGQDAAPRTVTLPTVLVQRGSGEVPPRA